MDFLELVERRLDYVQSYNSERHYKDTVYMAKRWVKKWNGLTCKQVTSMEIQSFLIHIQKTISAHTANKNLRYLRALFNFGKNKPNEWIDTNPTDGIKFFPVEKIPKYVPPESDILKVIDTADRETQLYLWTLTLTLGRMSEINNLKKSDVNFKGRIVTLYTRKKRDGSLTPREIPMNQRLYDVLKEKIDNDCSNHPWVFWHRYYSRKEGRFVEEKYTDRKTFMKKLCKKAGVRYFRFHPLRHFGASMLENAGVPVRTIQDLLGHENRTTTEIYLHSIKGSDREAMDLLGTALS